MYILRKLSIKNKQLSDDNLAPLDQSELNFLELSQTYSSLFTLLFYPASPENILCNKQQPFIGRKLDGVEHLKAPVCL